MASGSIRKKARKSKPVRRVFWAWLMLLVMFMLTPMSLVAVEQQNFFSIRETMPQEEVGIDEELNSLLESFLERGDNRELTAVTEAQNAQLAISYTGVVHEIGDWTTLMAFLDGTWPAGGFEASNADTFILTADISPPSGWVSLPNSRGTDAPWNNARIGRPGTFTGIFDGQGHTITGLVLRPRRNLAHETGTRTLSSNPYLNDYGFIRLMGNGAVIQDVTFIDALFYDGGNSSSNVAHNTRSTVITNLLAGWDSHINTASGSTGRTSNASSTHRGIVAGRVAPGANVTIDNVNLGQPITGDGTTRAIGYAANNISTSRHRGVWNFRMGGLIGATEEGSVVNVRNSNVSARLFHQTLGAGGRQGGIVGENRGSLNLIDVNVHVTMYESNWGLTHGHNTLYAGGIVGRNTGSLNVSNGNNEQRNTIHAGTIRTSNVTDRGGRYNSDNNGGGTTGATGRHWGFFRHAGRLVGSSSGPVNVSDVNLTGHVFGLDDIGGAVGLNTSSLILSNMNVSGTVGGTQMALASNSNPLRGTNAGGLVGRSTGPVIIDHVHVGLNLAGQEVGGNIYGGRRGASASAGDVLGVGGLIGSANSAMIMNSSFQGSGTLEMTGNVGGLIGRATGVVIIEDSFTGANVRMSNGGTETRHRPNGSGGIIGRVTPSGSVTMTSVINNMVVERNRGDVGGIIGRIQGRTLNLTGVENHGAVRQLSGGGAGAAGLINDWRNAGGLVGDANNTEIRIINSGNYGPIDAYARRRATGGLIGRATGGARTVHLENVENTSDVTRTMRGRGHVGGLIGRVAGPITIIDATNTGNVFTTGTTGSNDRVNTMGGLVGRADRGLTITNGVNEGHVVNNQNRTVRGLGGLVGYARGRTVITDSANSGNLASSVTTAARQTRGEANIGGIIGRSDMRGATRAGRQTILTNVENTGNIGMETHPVTEATLANNMVNSSGGIIGRSVARAGNSYNLTNVSNEGHVRGRNYTGGLIGFSNSLNVTIAQSTNYGLIENQWGTGARGHGGGFIGRTARNTLTIHQSYNAGDVRNINTAGNLGGNSLARLRSASHGGFVGLISSGHVNITESFNAGAIRGVERNTGGFVGISRGTGRLTISNGFNIGDVTSQLTGSGTGAVHVARRERAGNGVLGFRDRGPVVIQSVYNAGFVQGRPIYGSPAINPATVRPDRAIGTYISFFNAYYDNTIHAGVPQCVLRGTIGGVPTDIMTRGILPGFTNALWLSGTMDEGGTRLRNTYPYLAWQTGGELQEPFFHRIREIPDNLRAVMDLDGTGERATRFTIEERDRNNVRFFMPYTQTGEVPGPGRGVADHFAIITELSAERTFTRNGLLSAGVVSENYVVGFDIRDRTGVAVIGVDAMDYAIDPQTAEHISWATFNVDGQPVYAPAGILIVSWTRNLLYPYNLEETAPRYVEVAALGYADASRWVAVEDYLDNEEGLVRIPMDRVDIPYVEVRIVTETTSGTGDNEVINTVRVANSHLRHQRPPGESGPNLPALGDPPVDTRHFHLDSVQWRDVLHAGAPNFSQEEYVVRYGSFSLENPEQPPGPNNRHIIYIFLDDLQVQPNPMHLNVRWYDDRDSDTDTSDGSTPIWHNSNAASSTAGVTTHMVEWTVRETIGNVPDAAITSARTGRNDAGRHVLNNLLYTTELRVGAPGFRTSQWERVEDLFEYYEEGVREGERRSDIFIYLDRLITVNFTVVEYVFAGLDDDGEPIYNRVVIPNPEITRANALEDAEVELLSATRVRGIDGEAVRISAPGFVETVHTISWEEDIVERMGTAATEAYPPIPAAQRSEVSATGLATTHATAHITIVLERPPVYHVILESATPQYGMVTPGFVSVEPGQTMNQAMAPAIVTTPQDAFRFWDSIVGFPEQTWATTAQIRGLPITEPFTRFRAHFEASPQDLVVASVPEDANVEGKTATIGEDTPVPADTHSVMSGTEVKLYAGNADEDNFVFLGWWRGTTPPEVGTNVSELTGVHTDAIREFIKPAATTNYFALWGNDEGYIGIPNEPANEVVFNFYGTTLEPISVPIVIGEALDSDLVEEVIETKLNYGDTTVGHAFWGWFEDQELSSSNRQTPANSNQFWAGLRRPVVGAQCVDTRPGHNFNLEQVITQELFDLLEQEGNIYLYAIWALWGDLDDSDFVDFDDLYLLQRYVMFNDVSIRGVANMAAADVVFDGFIDFDDLYLVQRYVMFNDTTVVFGLRP